MILMIDNYDSFTFNLVQMIGEMYSNLKVVRNDASSVSDILLQKPKAIVISPGPGSPSDAGICVEVIKTLGRDTPILGVCLGHQCICEAYGGEVVRAEKLMHGKTSKVYHNKLEIFENIEVPFSATRYHSLIAKRDSLPDCLEIIAWTDDNEIMALRHREHPVYGVQFHPESVLSNVGLVEENGTFYGRTILGNFLKLVR